MNEPGGASDVLPYHPLAKRRRRRGWWGLLLRALVGLILLVFAGWMVDVGIDLRYDLWEKTLDVRFEGDVSNGLMWGKNADAAGLFRTYDYVAQGVGFSSMARLDYTPLRLAAVMYWARWVKVHYPDVGIWNGDYGLTSPMLHGNTAAELASAIFAFLIIRLWIVRMDDARLAPLARRRPFRGVAQGLAGALLLWFNPAVVWDGHAFPQWDIWLMPFFLAAVLLACLDWWFIAGICICIGAMLKGQMLLGAPIILIWPICQLRFGAVLRLISGFLLATAAIASFWMHPSPSGLLWYILIVFAMARLMPFVLGMNVRPWVLVYLAFTAALLAWPWASSAPFEYKLIGPALVGMVALARLLPRNITPHVYALAIAGALLTLMPVFDASRAWYDIGVTGGAEKFQHMFTGNGTYNLPALLNRELRMGMNSESPVTIPWIEVKSADGLTTIPYTLPYRQFAVLIYGICLLLCGIGAAIHYRRRDARFLVAMAAPWVIFYILMPQMHGRYLVWGAAISALLFGAGWGLGLLGVIISLIAWFGILSNQYTFTPDWDPQGGTYLRAVTPHLGWMLMLAAAVLLYLAAMPRSLRRRPMVVVEAAS